MSELGNHRRHLGPPTVSKLLHTPRCSASTWETSLTYQPPSFKPYEVCEGQITGSRDALSLAIISTSNPASKPAPWSFAARPVRAAMSRYPTLGRYIRLRRKLTDSSVMLFSPFAADARKPVEHAHGTRTTMLQRQACISGSRMLSLKDSPEGRER